MAPRIAVQESYRNWVPPVKVSRAVTRLLQSVPEKFVAGLGSVVLTNASGLNHSDRRNKTQSAGRKVRIADAGGLYHHAWRGQPAWIELFIDNIFDGYPKAMLSLPPVRDLLLGAVLFHELGHHTHKTHAPEFREKEQVADRWQKRFLDSYMRRRYWYIVRPLGVSTRLCRKLSRLMSNRGIVAGP